MAGLVLAPANEAARLAALHEYGLLDAPADRELAAVLRVAAAVAGVPTATINLIDAERQCQLTTVGFEGGDSPRDESMCSRSLAVGGFVYAPDASLHPLFADNPWVTGKVANLRFYAAVPLVTPDGHALGTICVFDDLPGELDNDQIARLEDLAEVVLALFERRRQARIKADLAVQLDRSNSELRRSNRDLQAFAGVVSHDLKAPLTVLHGYLEELSDNYSDCLDPRACGWLGKMISATGRMQQLIDGLLSYAQVEASRRQEPVDLSEVAGSVLSDLRPTIEAAAGQVTLGDLPTLSGDPVLLRQLFQNLLANAVKFARPDRPPWIEVSAQARADGWELAVADNGRGIPEGDRPQVFAMFQRLDHDLPGYGIGLATCQRIVDQHGGEIWAAETPGGGTTIHFTLPAGPAGDN